MVICLVLLAFKSGLRFCIGYLFDRLPSPNLAILSVGVYQERKSCPSCNSKAKKNDIRILFVPKVSVVDTTERDAVSLKLDEEKRARLNVSVVVERSVSPVITFPLARLSLSVLEPV